MIVENGEETERETDEGGWRFIKVKVHKQLVGKRVNQ